MDVESASAAYFGITVAPVMNILTNGIFGPHFRSNIIFALPLLEGNLWDLIFFDELLDGLDKSSRHRLHGIGRKHLSLPLLANES